MIYGKTVEELSSDLTINNGKVTGTLNKINDYTEFSNKQAEQSGHYFPFELVSNGKKMTFKKNGAISKKDINVDRYNVFRIESTTDTFEVLVDGKSVVKFDFTNVNLAE